MKTYDIGDSVCARVNRSVFAAIRRKGCYCWFQSGSFEALELLDDRVGYIADTVLACAV